MFSDRKFQVALLLSLITHGIILSQSPNLNLNIFSLNKKEQNLEVSYIKPTPESEKHPKTLEPKKEPLLKLPSKITSLKTTPPPFIDRESIFKKNKEIISQKYTFTKPTFIKPDVIAVKKKITLPPIDIDKVNNPSYISYYQIVREKIRRAAYQNYTRVEVGEVYLSFVILSDGTLKEIRLVEEKSSSSPYLKEIALRSIKEASPFPNFPKELDYPRLSFNVVISFEIE
jgi:TonB family protein